MMNSTGGQLNTKRKSKTTSWLATSEISFEQEDLGVHQSMMLSSLRLNRANSSLYVFHILKM